MHYVHKICTIVSVEYMCMTLYEHYNVRISCHTSGQYM